MNTCHGRTNRRPWDTHKLGSKKNVAQQPTTNDSNLSLSDRLNILIYNAKYILTIMNVYKAKNSGYNCYLLLQNDTFMVAITTHSSPRSLCLERAAEPVEPGPVGRGGRRRPALGDAPVVRPYRAAPER